MVPSEGIIDLKSMPPDPFPPLTLMLSPDMLARRIIWDMIPDDIAVDVIEEMELEPASEDVDEMERVEAVKRAMPLSPIAMEIVLMCNQIAHILEAGMLVSGGESYPPEVLITIVQPAVTAVVKELVSMGRIQIVARKF